MNAKNIFGAFCVAIALFFVWPAVFGSWSEMQALKAAVKEREAIVTQRDAILKEAATQYVKYSEIKKSDLATVLASFVPSKKDSAELVSAASSIAVTSGLQLKSLKVAEAATRSKSKEAYETMSLSLELSGPYGGLRTFLNDLESYVRLLNVKKIEIRQAQQGGELIFAIQADTYYIK